MIAYSFDHTGLYVGPVKCQPCKVRVGEFLLPSHATFVKPPERIDGKSIVWNGSKWEYRPAPKPLSVIVKDHLVTEEIRDDERLLSIMIGNLKADLLSEHNKNVGVLRGAVEDLSRKVSEKIKKSIDSSSELKIDVQAVINRMGSLEQENAVLRTRIDGLKEEILLVLRLIDESNLRSLDLQKRIEHLGTQEVETPVEESGKDVAVSEKKFSLKFWS